MGKFNIWMGVSCVLFMVIGSNILRRFSWLTSALVTPMMMSFTGIIFFVCVIFAQDISFLPDGLNPIYFAVIIGAVQNILSKSSKYSLFDATKEMTYIPLSIELRTKGKAAVEVVGLKFGKSLGAFVQSFIFIFVPMATFDSITTYLMIVFIIIMVLWVVNIKFLNLEYLKLRGDDESN
jgi:ATP:ADP antiporter, AAA family